MTFSSVSYRAAPRAYTAVLPFWIGLVFCILMSFPGFLEFPGGIPGAIALIFLGFPFWFRAAQLRDGAIFDPAARAGLGLILLSIAFLVMWAFISAIGADIPFRAGRSIASLAAAFAIYLLVSGTFTASRQNRYLATVSFTLAATCLASFVVQIDPTLRNMLWWTDRTHAFFKNPNQFGMALSTMMPVAIGYLFLRRGARLRWMLCIFLFYLGLMLSGSKMNLLLSAATTGVTILAAICIMTTGKRRVVMIALGFGMYLLLVVAGFLLLNILNPRAVEILTRFFSPDLEVQSLQSRSVLWHFSIDQFRADPFFGQGAGQPIPLPEGGTISHSHNIVLDYIRTMGLPGLCGFLVMAVTAVILALEAIRMALIVRDCPVEMRVTTMTLGISTLTYLAANFSSDSMGPSTSPFFWLSFFLCLASRRYLSSASKVVSSRGLRRYA
ncbi:O-antigen ligase [Palleronia aestuarii]|uniref:O-antigen ligase n=1 Tax=Palleronia aestuarii TaxID=568105 RepID=A0A2W7MQX8_9RHOB|nr:O-antigen ligase family protein [Palleronia aestuarii]PZX09973.1 O-antigen ligase [Palleronia aestuarii]